MVNLQDQREAQRQAQQAAMEQKLTSEQQRELERKILAEKERERQAAENAERKQAEREAHRKAEDEAFRIAKETEGSQRITIRTTFTENEAKSKISGKTINRRENLPNQQYSQSGAPVNLQGDPQAIQKIRAEAFQLAQERGGTVDQAAVNRATRDLLAEKGGNVSIIDEAGRRQAVNEAYQDLKYQYSTGRPLIDDEPILVPASGIRSRSVFEGFSGAGGKQTIVIAPPKTEKVTVDLPPPKNDFFEGFATNIKNLGIDFELSGKGIGLGIGSIFSLGNKNAQKNIISKAEAEGRLAESMTGRELEREFVGSTIQTGISTAQGKPSVEGFGMLGKDIMASPLFFAGSGAASAAVYLTPYGISKAFRFFGAAPKIAPRARFDYNPALGSFADRPSVRFGPYNPTRWENPEALAELSKFKMSVDLPKVAKIAPLATSVRTTEAFESVRGRQDVIVQSRGGSLILKPEPLSASVKVEPLGLQVAKQTASRAESVGANIRKNWIAPTVPLGIGGLTGAERRRRRDTSIFSTELETVAFPKGSQAEKIFGRVGKVEDASSFLAGQRDLTSQFSKVSSKLGRLQSNKTDLSQRTTINTMMREMQETTTMQSIMTAQMTRQLTKQVTGTTTVTTNRFVIETPKIPKITIPNLPNWPGGDKPKTKKGKKGRKGIAALREGQIKDLVTVALGEENQLAKAFRRSFNKYF